MWTGPPSLNLQLTNSYSPTTIPGAFNHSSLKNIYSNEPSTSSIFDADWASVSALQSPSPVTSTLNTVYPSYLGLLPACDLFSNPSVVQYNEVGSRHVPYTSATADLVPRASLSPITPISYLGIDLSSSAALPLTPILPVATTPQIVPCAVTPPVTAASAPLNLSPKKTFSIITNGNEIEVEFPKRAECNHKRGDREKTCDICTVHDNDGQISSIGLSDLVDIVFKTAEKLKPTIDGVSHHKDVLERKRKQNKIAAAKYRTRQKNKREQMMAEINELTDKNGELRETVTDLESQIAEVRTKLLNFDSQ